MHGIDHHHAVTMHYSLTNETQKQDRISVLFFTFVVHDIHLFIPLLEFFWQKNQDNTHFLSQTIKYKEVVALADKQNKHYC